jgi:hypothetical protein
MKADQKVTLRALAYFDPADLLSFRQGQAQSTGAVRAMDVFNLDGPMKIGGAEAPMNVIDP